MKKQLKQAEEFVTAFGQKTETGYKPLLKKKEMNLRFNLQMEELYEYREAHQNGDKEGVADALVDQMYVLLGTIQQHGLGDKFEALFDEVHRANMSKLGEDGKPIRRFDGKILKPEGWKGPDFSKILDL